MPILWYAPKNWRRKGAQVVIGFEEKLLVIEAVSWIDSFFLALANGETVEKACEEALDNVKKLYEFPHYSSASSYVAGDKNRVFATQN